MANVYDSCIPYDSPYMVYEGGIGLVYDTSTMVYDEASVSYDAPGPTDDCSVDPINGTLGGTADNGFWGWGAANTTTE